VRLDGLLKPVVSQIKKSWSPKQITGRLLFDGLSVRVSHKTYYAYVYGPVGQLKEPARYQPNWTCRGLMPLL